MNILNANGHVSRSARKPWRHHVASCVGAAGRVRKGLVPTVNMSVLQTSNSYQVISRKQDLEKSYILIWTRGQTGETDTLKITTCFFIFLYMFRSSNFLHNLPQFPWKTGLLKINHLERWVWVLEVCGEKLPVLKIGHRFKHETTRFEKLVESGFLNTTFFNHVFIGCFRNFRFLRFLTSKFEGRWPPMAKLDSKTQHLFLLKFWVHLEFSIFT